MKDLILDHKDDFRMFGLVPYNISDKQKGIQFLHAIQEYNNLFFDTKRNEKEIKSFNGWRLFGKTVIMYDGGTTNSRIIEGKPFGTLNQHLNTLKELDVLTSEFYEPDLGEQLSAIAFILPKQVYKIKEFPNFKDYVILYENLSLAFELCDKYDLNNTSGEVFQIHYKKWVDFLGGENNVKLREFIKNFKYA